MVSVRRGAMGIPRTVARAAAVVALVTGACSGGGGEDPPVLAAVRPEGFSVTGDSGQFDVVVLSWGSPRTSVDLEVQRRIDGGEWVAQPYRVPASTAMLRASVREVPERTTLGFRVRTLLGEASSAWSEEVTVQRGIRPASGMSITYGSSARGPIHWVRWTRGSLLADRVRLERQTRPHFGEPGPWVELPVAADATSYEDVNPPGDLARWVYRVTYWAGELASEPVDVQSGAGGPAAPIDLSAAVAAGDVRVTWVNASTAATAILITRTKAGAAELRSWTLPGEATSLEDPGLSPGLYEYTLLPTVAGSESPYSRARVVALVPSPTHVSTYPARALYLPFGTGVARRADGAFAVACGLGDATSDPAFVYALGAMAWERFETPRAAGLARPGALLDATGGVHAIYLESHWAGATHAPVRHARHDGAGWHVESVGLAPPGATASGAIAADGGVHVVWRLEDDTGFAYATNAGGSFVVREVRPVPDAQVRLLSPLVFDGNTPRLLVGERNAASPRAWLVSRGGSSWSAAQLPDVAALPEDGGSLVAGGGSLAWVYARWNGTGFDLWVHERKAGAWGPAWKFASTSTPPLAGLGVAISPDGSRLAVVTPAVGGTAGVPAKLFVLEGTTVRVTDLLLSSGVPQVGYTPGGKLWVLDGLRSGGPGTSAYVLYEEP